MKLWEALKLLDEKKFRVMSNGNCALYMDKEGAIAIRLLKGTAVFHGHCMTDLLVSDGWEGVE